jgi:hypothetical protein
VRPAITADRRMSNQRDVSVQRMPRPASVGS